MVTADYHFPKQAFDDLLDEHKINPKELLDIITQLDKSPDLASVRLAIQGRNDGIPLEVRADYCGSKEGWFLHIPKLPMVQNFFDRLQTETSVKTLMPRLTVEGEYGDIAATLLRGQDFSNLDLYIKGPELIE